MFDPGQVIVGLEIGTHKICVAVGEAGPKGELKILGIGQCTSRGVRKGEITDTLKAEEDIRIALVEAEQQANVEIEEVFLGISGNHIRCLDSRGVHSIASFDRTITNEDVADAVANAKQFNCPAEHEVIDSVRQDYKLDDLVGIENPVGLVGGLLEASVHVIQGRTSRIETARRLVQKMQISVAKPVFNGLASALAVLTPEQKQQGVVLLDLGAGTTEYTFFHGGILRHSGVLAVGGDHVSNDLACGLRIPIDQAEKLKRDHGSACFDPAVKGTTHTLPSETGLEAKTISIEHLHRIMSLRIEETLELVARDLVKADVFGLARAGVVLCGGGARTNGIETLVKRTFQLPVGRAHTHNVSGPADVLANPEFATAIGLVRYGAMRRQNRPRSRFDFRHALQTIFRR
jgi:cell division protein FtsA